MKQSSVALTCLVGLAVIAACGVATQQTKKSGGTCATVEVQNGTIDDARIYHAPTQRRIGFVFGMQATELKLCNLEGQPAVLTAHAIGGRWAHRTDAFLPHIVRGARYLLVIEQFRMWIRPHPDGIPH